MKAAYEEKDANIRGLLGIAAGLAVTVMIVAFLATLLLRAGSQDRHDRNDESELGIQSLRTVSSASTRPTAGNMTHPAPGTLTNLDETNARLHSFGWSDAAHTRVHIPIEDAMHLLVIQGDSHANATMPAAVHSTGNFTPSPSPGPADPQPGVDSR